MKSSHQIWAAKKLDRKPRVGPSLSKTPAAPVSYISESQIRFCASAVSESHRWPAESLRYGASGQGQDRQTKDPSRRGLGRGLALAHAFELSRRPGLDHDRACSHRFHPQCFPWSAALVYKFLQPQKN